MMMASVKSNVQSIVQNAIITALVKKVKIANPPWNVKKHN